MKIELIEDNITSSEDLQLLTNELSHRNSKKFPNIINNVAPVSKPPLEIINENLRDFSENSQDHKNDVQNLAITNQIKNTRNTEKNIFSLEYSKESQTKGKSLDQQNGDSQNQMPSENYNRGKDQKRLANKKTNTTSKNFKVVLNITNIIPEKKLLYCNDDEVLFHSDLKKMIANDTSPNSSKIYSTRFCLATKLDFRYYKSKEQFLTLQKPLMIIPFCQIVEVKIAKIGTDSKKVLNLFLRLDNTNRMFDVQSSRIDLKNSRIVNENNEVNTKYNKLSLIPFEGKNTQHANESQILMQNETFLIFSNESEELINKWFVVINYFMNK